MIVSALSAGQGDAVQAAIQAANALTQSSAQDPDLNPDLSLVIEDDKAAGEYVYKTVNRSTGEVVSQWPTAQLLQLRQAPDYSPGAVLNQSA